MKTKADYIVRFIYLLIAAGIALAIVATQARCKDKPTYIPPTPVQVIEQKHNPVIDSLKKLDKLRADSIVDLTNELKKQKTATLVSEKKATATIDKLKTALAAKDTGKIITYSEDAANEYTAFKEEVAKQDSIQEAIISKQAERIETLSAETEIHAVKFTELKTAYNIKEIEANDWKEAANKYNRKLKRAKFWNKVFGIGTAAGVALAGIVFL